MMKETTPRLRDFMNWVIKRNTDKRQFLQAVGEVAEDIIPFVTKIRGTPVSVCWNDSLNLTALSSFA